MSYRDIARLNLDQIRIEFACERDGTSSDPKDSRKAKQFRQLDDLCLKHRLTPAELVRIETRRLAAMLGALTGQPKEDDARLGMIHAAMVEWSRERWYVPPAPVPR